MKTIQNISAVCVNCSSKLYLLCPRQRILGEVQLEVIDKLLLIAQAIEADI